MQNQTLVHGTVSAILLCSKGAYYPGAELAWGRKILVPSLTLSLHLFNNHSMSMPITPNH